MEYFACEPMLVHEQFVEKKKKSTQLTKEPAYELATRAISRIQHELHNHRDFPYLRAFVQL